MWSRIYGNRLTPITEPYDRDLATRNGIIILHPFIKCAKIYKPLKYLTLQKVDSLAHNLAEVPQQCDGLGDLHRHAEQRH